jgi:hypothetical protein
MPSNGVRANAKISAKQHKGAIWNVQKMIDWKKEANETDKLTSELQRRGIELPKDPALWFDDLEEQSGTLEEIEVPYRSYLTPKGKAIAHASIRKANARMSGRGLRSSARSPHSQWE